MKDSELRSRISKKARDYILSNYSWTKIGDKWDKMIQEVCNE